MEGGIRAWRGLVAQGPPEAGMAHFPPGAGAQQLIALAWYLEAGSRAFYAGLAAAGAAGEEAALFDDLGRAEQGHMAALQRLYAETAGADADADFPRSVLPQEPPDAFMEGGVEVRAALTWSRGKERRDLLEYCVSLEANSYDLYLKLRQSAAAEGARRVFSHLVREEQRHLEALTARLERALG